MTDEASPPESSAAERPRSLTLTTRDDYHGPSLIDDVMLTQDPMGMVVAHFFHDYFAVPPQTTFHFGEGASAGSASTTSRAIRHVRASLVMHRSVARAIGNDLVAYADELDEEEE